MERNEMDPDRIYDTDIDPRVEDGYVLADSDLLTYDEWWREHNANFCCRMPSNFCACGGYTDRLPSGASRLLEPEGPDPEELHYRRMESRAAYRRQEDA